LSFFKLDCGQLFQPLSENYTMRPTPNRVMAIVAGSTKLFYENYHAGGLTGTWFQATKYPGAS